VGDPEEIVKTVVECKSDSAGRQCSGIETAESLVERENVRLKNAQRFEARA